MCLRQGGTILFLCCAVMWFLVSFGFEGGAFGLVDPENSLIAAIAGFIAPIFIPLGFGDWRPVAATLSGFVAKEGLVSTMAQLTQLGAIEEYDPAMQTVAPCDIVRTLKSISAIEMFKAFPQLKQFYTRCGVLWSRGYFVSTVGHISEATVKKYIEEQKNHD